MRPDEIWDGESPKARVLRLVLTPLSWLYALGWESYLAVYRLGLKKAKEPHPNVICIGSLLVGGSGKSPLTIHLVRVLQSLGKQVVIGSSGYGAPHSKEASLAPMGALRASEWGDEPSMFRWLLPDIPQVVGRRRVLAAQLVQDTFPGSVLLMDDGFQHLPLKKRIQLLLVDPKIRNRMCLPAGPHREPHWNRKRADLIIPDVYQVVSRPMVLVNQEGGEEKPAQYAVICALGQPTRFLAALREHFPNQLSDPPVILLQDHDPLLGPDLWKSIPDELAIVVTSKDWVKIRDRSDVSERVFLIARQEVTLEPQDEFRNWLAKKLDE